MGSWQRAVGSWQWAVGSWQEAVGGWQWAGGSGEWEEGSSEWEGFLFVRFMDGLWSWDVLFQFITGFDRLDLTDYYLAPR